MNFNGILTKSKATEQVKKFETTFACFYNGGLKKTGKTINSF